MPLRITTDQGRQFESNLFNELARLIGAMHLRTSAYHLAANGIVERLHRQMKAAIKCHETEAWAEILPIILLEIRTAIKENLKAGPAELVYGTTIRLPGEFFQAFQNMSCLNFAEDLRKKMQKLKPVLGTRHEKRNVFIFKELPTSSHVFLRHNAARGPLQNTYDGPFQVVDRNEKTSTIIIHGKRNIVSIDRLKPAFILNENLPKDEHKGDDNVEEEIETRQSEEQLPTANEKNDFNIRAK